MRLLTALLLTLLCSPAFSVAPVVVDIDPANGRAETIRNLNINGALYNASFDQAFGENLFEGDTVAANAAVDAIVAVLNPDYPNVDNGHPLEVPLFWVLFSADENRGYSACRSVYVPECSSRGWENVGELFGGISEGALVFFELVTPVAIDVLPGDAANKVYPNKGGQVPVAVLSAADFDASQVNPVTLRFGAAEAAPAGAAVISDVDGLYGPDATVKFRMAETGIFCADTEVSLTGETYAGDPFTGTDAIDASECESGGCHVY
jgi:hypothetical protein